MSGAEAILRLTWREDGGLRIDSPTHPNLLLSHSRPDLVMLDVLPALSVMGFAASADTRPKGGDGTKIAAPFTSGAVPEGQTPNPSPSPAAGR